LQHSSRYPILLFALVCAFTLGASLRNPLVWSSPTLVVGNAATADFRSALGSFVPSRWRESAQTTLEAYRPVANLTFALDNTLWPGVAGGYHLSNLLLHMLAVASLYFVSRAVLSGFGIRHAGAGACLSALTLAIHPALVEAAIWIENRAVLVCTTLCFVSFGLLASHWRRRGRPLAYAGASLAFVAALITQEAAVALPLSFALYAALRTDGRDRRAHLAQTLPFFAAAAIFACLRASVLKPGTVMVSDTPPIPFDHRALAVVRTVGGYLATLLLPVRLCSDRYFVIPRGMGYPGMVSSVAALALWAAPFGLARRCPRWAWFGLASVLAALLPVSNIVFIPGRPMADQRLYLPALGICVLAGGTLASCLPARRLRRWLLVGALCAFSALAIDRVFDFRTEYAFWLDTACNAPRKGRTKLNLGIECRDLELLDRAEKLLRSVIRRYPMRTVAYRELWRVLLVRDRTADALAVLLRAGEAAPATPVLLVEIGATLCMLKRYEEAMPYLDRAKSMKATPSTAWFWASHVWQARGDKQEAKSQLEEAERRMKLERAGARGGTR